ncbi:NUMOD4 motif-containing HNH endonuclease [Microbacterium sp. A18JL200]|uniref:NUMOD4 motif-containing HNH endonuclease n=1 Tax=Microbacterium luteum TaxID=2782167 RepID=UPI001888EDE7
MSTPLLTPLEERWLPVPGYEGLYEVSDLGRVRSLDRVVMNGGRRSNRTGRVLSPGRVPGANNGHQYPTVVLSRRGEHHTARVHRLVAESFCEGRAPGLEVRHIDGDPTNNAATNLRWGTKSENQRDTTAHGTHRNARKTHCSRNHPLEAPNLEATRASRGWRLCLACKRARAQSVATGVPLSQEMADAHYARISGATS